MFAQGPRFPDKVANSDLPGPNAYDFKSSLLSDDRSKHFGFISKSNRFKQPKIGEERIDDLSLEDDNSSIVSSSNTASFRRSVTLVPSQRGKDESFRYKKEAERWQEQYERQQLNHQKQITILEERIAKLDAMLSTNVKEKQNLQAVLVAREKELSELMHRQVLLKANLEKSEKSSLTMLEKAAKSATLQRKVEDLEKQTGKIRTQNDKKTSTLEKLQKERDELRAVADNLRVQVEEMEVERIRFQNAAADAEKAKGVLESRAGELEQMLDQARKDVTCKEAKLMADITDLQKNADSLSREKNEMEIRLEAVGAALSAARSERDRDALAVQKLEAKIGSIEAKLTQVESEKSALKLETAGDKARVKEVLETLSALERDYATGERERDDMSKTNKMLEADNSNLRDSIIQLTKMKHDLQTKLSRIEEGHRTDEEEYRVVIAGLKKALADLQASNSDRVAEYDAKLAELSEHLGSALEEIERRQLIIDNSSQSQDELRSQIDDYHNALIAAKHEVEGGWEKIKCLESREADLLGRINDLEGSLKSVSAALALKDSELARTQERVADLAEQISVLSVSLYESEAALKESRNAHNEAIVLHDMKVEELVEQLQDERRIREGERNMSEIRIAQAQDVAEKSAKKFAEQEAALETTVGSLRAEISSLQREMESLTDSHRREIGQLKYSVVESEETLALLRERVAEGDEALEQASETVDQLLSEKNATAKALSQAVAKITELEGQLNERLKVEERTLATVKDLELRSAEVEAEIIKAREDLASANSRGEEYRRMREELEQKLLATSSEHSKSITELSRHASMLEAEIIKAHEDLASANARCEEYRKLREEVEQKFLAASNEHSRSIADLSHHVSELDTEIIQTREDLASANARCEEYRRLREEVEQKFLVASNEHSRSMADLSHHVSELDTEIIHSREDLASANARCEEYRRLREEVEQKFLAASKEHSRSIADLSHHVSELETEVIQAREDLASAKARCEELQAEKRMVEMYSAEAKDKQNLLVQALRQAKSDNDDKASQITKLSLSIAEKSTEFEMLKEERQLLASRHSQAEDEVSAIRRGLADLQTRLDRANRLATDRESEMKAVQSELAAYRLRSSNEIGRRDEEIRDLREKLGQKERDIDMMRTSADNVDKIREDYAKVQSHVASLEETIANLRRQASEDTDRARADLEVLARENQRLIQQDEASERRIAELEELHSREREFLSKNYAQAFEDVKKLSSVNADLIGHQNAHQKIKHIKKMKEDLLKLRGENTRLTQEREYHKMRIMSLERDLEALNFSAASRPIVRGSDATRQATSVPVISHPPHGSRNSLNVSSIGMHVPPTAGRVPVSNHADHNILGHLGPRKVSRAARTVLSAKSSYGDVASKFSTVDGEVKQGLGGISFEIKGGDLSSDVSAVMNSSEGIQSDTDKENKSGTSFFVDLS